MVENFMKRSVFSLYFLFFLAISVSAAQAGEYSQKMARQWQVVANNSAGESTTIATERGKNSQSKKHKKSSGYSTAMATPAIAIDYDKVSDHLSINAENASLKAVLARVAKLSGIEVLFDDAADESVNINIQSESLDAGLKILLKGRNSALRYSRDKNNSLLIIGVTVLPAGVQGGGHAKRTRSLHAEAYERASVVLTHEQLQEIDIARQRWLVRKGEMSPERREKVEARVNARLEKKAIRKQERAERKKAKSERRAKSEAERQAIKARRLEHLTAEELDEYNQVRAEAREQVRVQMFGNSAQ